MAASCPLRHCILRDHSQRLSVCHTAAMDHFIPLLRSFTPYLGGASELRCRNNSYLTRAILLFESDQSSPRERRPPARSAGDYRSGGISTNCIPASESRLPHARTCSPRPPRRHLRMRTRVLR